MNSRLERLVAALRELELDGAYVSKLVNVRYLSGFTGSNGALLVPADGEVQLLTDGRYLDQARAQTDGVNVVLSRMLHRTAGSEMAGRWGVETHVLSVDDHEALRDAADDDVELVSLPRTVETLREVKDEDEIDALRRACRISVEALQGLLCGPLAGRTEREVARDLEWRMLELGAEAIAFETILASGPNSAIPHHRPTDRLLQTGDLVKADFGARVDGYHADCTRTVVLGRADDWQREIHNAVRAAQAAGVDALRPDTPVTESDTVARAVLEDAGWLEHFTTGLGHGVGLEIHEDPFIGPRHAGRLASRTTLTMEPGIYVPGRGGVRIEDTVLVTEPSAGGDPEVLTPMTTELLEIA